MTVVLAGVRLALVRWGENLLKERAMSDLENSRPKKSKTGKVIGIGCLTIIVLLVCGGLYVRFKLPTWTAVAIRKLAEHMVQVSQLPEDQKTGITEHMERLALGAEEKRIGFAELQQAIEKLVKGPGMSLIVMHAMEVKYVSPSGLTEQQKKGAVLTFQRFSRGVIEEKIPAQQIQDVLALVQTTDQKGRAELEESLTDDELMALIDQVKKHADDAQIPLEPYEVDIAEHIGKVVDAVFGNETEAGGMTDAEK